jgi:hypothetical protein
MEKQHRILAAITKRSVSAIFCSSSTIGAKFFFRHRRDSEYLTATTASYNNFSASPHAY